MSFYLRLRCLRPQNLGFYTLRAMSNCYTNFQRPFSSSKSENTQNFCSTVFETKEFKDFVESSVTSYKANQEVVDSEMTHMLNSHKLLLFMEGSVDQPKSLCAGNIVKMFTLLQVLNFHTVDVLSNKEVYGFLCTKLGEPVRNVLFKDGNPFAGHDELLELFKSGKLLEALGSPKASSKATPKQFSGHLPVANF